MPELPPSTPVAGSAEPGTEVAWLIPLTAGQFAEVMTFLGNPSLALMLSAASALWVLAREKGMTLRQLAKPTEQAIKEAGLTSAMCKTRSLKLHGYVEAPLKNEPRGYYGADLKAIENMESEFSDLSQPLCDSLFLRKSDIIWAVRKEMARTVEDVLARRTRTLFLNAAAAQAIAPAVAKLMAAELGRDESWCESQCKEFDSIAAHFTPDQGAN